MSSTKRCCSLLTILVVGIIACVPVFAGSAVVGSVAGSMNATIEGQTLLPNTVIFTGQSLSVKDGAAVVATSTGERMVFGRDTKASFSRNEEELTVQLAQGNVSLFEPTGNGKLRVKAGNVSVVSSSAFKTLCEVAMVGDAIVVTTQKGSVRVEGNGAPVEVAQGRTITISPRTARAPRPQGGVGMSTSTALQVGAIGAGGLSAILAGVSISRAGQAKDAANKADLDAQGATAAVNGATSAAEAADADAKAATAAANAATAQAVAVGCALNAFNDQLDVGLASPYTPPSGTTSPVFVAPSGD